MAILSLLNSYDPELEQRCKKEGMPKQPLFEYNIGWMLFSYLVLDLSIRAMHYLLYSQLVLALHITLSLVLYVVPVKYFT